MDRNQLTSEAEHALEAADHIRNADRWPAEHRDAAAAHQNARAQALATLAVAEAVAELLDFIRSSGVPVERV